MARRVIRLFDLSVVLLLALIVIVGWFYGGPPEEAQRRRASFVTGVDNFLGGMGHPQVIAQYGGIDEEPEINARVKAIFDKVRRPAAREGAGRSALRDLGAQIGHPQRLFAARRPDLYHAVGWWSS